MIRILRMDEISEAEIFERNDSAADVSDIVAGIVADVRARGDAALLEYTERFDHAVLRSLQVSKEEFDEAMALVDPRMQAVLKKAAASIRAFHNEQRRNGFILNDRKGVVMGQKVLPLERVGLYVPGGTAAYPSTVLMDSIPAKIAGVKELMITTPPGKDGKVDPVILAAARIAGVDRVFKVGGAQAVAALAYGTESIPKADKIVGPGNAFVAEAKRQIFGIAAIDMIAGPSEILIVADAKTDPAYTAADLLSQAEHDINASAVLITDSEVLAREVQAELEKQLPLLPREEIARASIEARGKIIVTRISRAPSPRRTGSRRSIWSSLSTGPSTIWTRCKTPVPYFWGAAVRKPSAITWPVPITRCPPAGPPAFPAPFRWTTLSKRSSTPIFRRRPSGMWRETWPFLRNRKAFRPTPEARSSAFRRRDAHESIFLSQV